MLTVTVPAASPIISLADKNDSGADYFAGFIERSHNFGDILLKM
jgi:hypothetical protein